MNPTEKLLIDDFLSKANHKLAQSQQKLFKISENEDSQPDIQLGISTPMIKQYIQTVSVLSLDAISVLVCSEYNEARVFGWALLFRDYPESHIIQHFARNFSSYSKNWNVVDFAASMSAKILLKNGDHKTIQALGYEILYSQKNTWSHRFALMLAIPLAQQGELNYAIDVVERSLEFHKETISKPCALILREIGIQNKNILRLFVEDNYQYMSKPLQQEFKKCLIQKN